jgi:hypothetical protein
MSLEKGGSISIIVNDKNNSYFNPGMGLRQGDPLSPLLFNLVVDVFTRMLSKAADKGYIIGLLNSMHPEGTIGLQYADDTLLFLEHGYLSVSHLKWQMTFFEKLTRMKINYNKSDLTQSI